tara:strand:+ start:724 stop:1149 length:426 start_codon:yes stop_codon:yes gene_type:complete
MSDKLDKMTKALAANTKVADGKLVPMSVDNINLTNDAEEDYNIARDNLKKLLNKSDEALDHMMQVAAEAEHPRAFEVLAGMFKTSADMTTQLIDLQKKRHELDKLNNEPDQPTNVQNNLYVGSTAELQRLLAKDNDDESTE